MCAGGSDSTVRSKQNLVSDTTTPATMACTRCLRTLTKTTPFLFRNLSSLRSLALPPFHLAKASSPVSTKPASAFAQWPHLRYFSSDKQDDHSDEEDYSEEEDYEDDDDDDDVPVSSRKKVYTAEEKEAEAEAIGYRVVGPLSKDNDVFKPYEPVFAVVQVHLFKHSAIALFWSLFN